MKCVVFWIKLWICQPLSKAPKFFDGIFGSILELLVIPMWHWYKVYSTLWLTATYQIYFLVRNNICSHIMSCDQSFIYLIYHCYLKHMHGLPISNVPLKIASWRQKMKSIGFAFESQRSAEVASKQLKWTFAWVILDWQGCRRSITGHIKTDNDSVWEEYSSSQLPL